MSDFNLYEIEGIRAFVQQAVQRADPSLDISPGSPLDTELVTPLVERLGPDPYDTPIEDFIRARLRSEFPELVLQDGDPLDDYAVKVMRILLEPFRRQIKMVSQGQSIASTQTLNDEEADNLAANFFVRRKEGGYSVGVARLYCSSPQSLLVTPSNSVSTGSGLRFFPVENQAITADLMQVNSEGGLYYFDVVVRAEDRGSEYNIDIGDLVSVSNLGNVVKVTNKNSFSEGDDRETTEEFLARVEESLNEKSLVTTRGIRSRLFDVFDNVQSVQVIGFGDPEMMRDLIESNDYSEYGAFTGTASPGSLDTISLVSMLGDAGTNFEEAGVQIGDRLVLYRASPQATETYTVTAVASASLGVTPQLSAAVTAGFFTISRKSTTITLSGIPGGILAPVTPQGEITVANGTAHIGGMLDVFLRAGAPQQRSIDLRTIRDADPLHYGIDLESFGASTEDRMVDIIDFDGELQATGTGNEVLVFLNGAAGLLWYPDQTDIGRYIQIRGGTVTTNHGTYRVESVGYRDQSGVDQVIHVVLSATDYETGAPITLVDDGKQPFRVKTDISVKTLVRDRDNSNNPAGIDFSGLGVKIGDSVILETSDDADIYTVRRILDSIGSGDVLLLSQELTSTVTPSGTGNGTGIRYRIADALDIDLISPRTTKVPLGDIWDGTDLSTVAGSKVVTVAGGSNFVLAGVEPGDALEILEGAAAGLYIVESVTSSTATLTTEVPATTFNVAYTVYTSFDSVERPLVRVKDIELLDSSSQPTGVKVPYGDIIDARIRGQLSNRAAGKEIESRQGVINIGTSLYTVTDTSVDFVAEGVVPGFRVSVVSGANAGNYVVKTVTSNTLVMYTAAEGGTAFIANDSAIHYTVGQPSTGYVRLYFLEPTSISMKTGLIGARLSWTQGDTVHDFMLSEVEGSALLPAPGSDDEQPNDLRLVQRIDNGGIYDSILEFTDTANPDVFEMELRLGDVIDVHQQIPLKNDADNIMNFYGGQNYQAGVVDNYFAGIPGVMTTAGSDIVRLPEISGIRCSDVNFENMADDLAESLVGQRFVIEDGPDAGTYIIEEVVAPGHLRLNASMLSSTDTVTAICGAAPAGSLVKSGNDGILTSTGVGSTGWSGQYVTIYELRQGNKGSVIGTWQITSRTSNDVVTLKDVYTDLAVTPTTSFRWIRTLGSTPWRRFSIYDDVPRTVEITEVGTVGPDRTGVFTCAADVTKLIITRSSGDFLADGVVSGDTLEITHGQNSGVYIVDTVSAPSVTLIAPVPVVLTGMTGRIRGGIHGNTRMVRTTEFDGNTGFLRHGFQMPYTVRRPTWQRVCSTDMEPNFDGTLYYVDLQIESMGCGDDLNLVDGERLVVESSEHVEIDGYTYDVDNNVLSYSPYEQVSLRFDRRILPVGNSDLPENLMEISGRNMKIGYEVSPTTRIVDDLLHSDLDRPVNANPVARHFLPQYVHATLSYSGGSSASVVGPEVEDYINGLGATEPLAVSNIEKFVVRRGATYIRHPIELVVVTHDLDRKLVVDRSVDAISEATVSYNGSARTSTFFASLDEGLNVVRE